MNNLNKKIPSNLKNGLLQSKNLSHLIGISFLISLSTFLLNYYLIRQSNINYSDQFIFPKQSCHILQLFNSGIKMANKELKEGGNHWDEMSMGFLNYEKASSDLLQNCDLPPPLKLVSGPDFSAGWSRSKMYGNTIGQGSEEIMFYISRNESEGQKMEVLKALRLSQTRARDAEMKSALLRKEKECISVMFLQESLQLMAYKQCVQILELQLSILKRQEKKQSVPKLVDEKKDACNFTLLVAMAFCLGAGIGYSFRWAYIF